MKIVLVFAAFVAIAVAAPAADSPTTTPVAFLRYDSKVDDFGQFAVAIETADGLVMTRQGELKPTADGKDFVLVQSGFYAYTAPDGSDIRVEWTADEDGFHPKGKHIPVAPAVPAA